MTRPRSDASGDACAAERARHDGGCPRAEGRGVDLRRSLLHRSVWRGTNDEHTDDDECAHRARILARLRPLTVQTAFKHPGVPELHLELRVVHAAAP